MSVLEKYEPQKALQFFEEICNIPHGSRNTKAISDYCVKFAQDRNLSVIQDEYNNIIITKPATLGYENEVGFIIQGHLDMVCVKEEGSLFDFETDSLQLETDGEWVWAKETTLGADDGIAVAMTLAILDSKEIAHPQIEAIFTVDEEIGLIGAEKIDLSMVTGKKMINIDSDEDHLVFTSCAGGTFLEGSLPVVRESKTGILMDLELKGLQGGHSGAEIHQERGNSNMLMGRILHSLKQPFALRSFDGGTATNVIPSITRVSILVEEQFIEAITTEFGAILNLLKKEYEIAEPTMDFLITVKEEEASMVLDIASQECIITALLALPNGVHARSLVIENLVETSSNLGVANLTEDAFDVAFNVRSSKGTAMDFAGERISAILRALGGTANVKGKYPAWEYRVNSELRDTVVDVYEEIVGEKPEICAIHAGLECGCFDAKIQDLDCVSIGPNLKDIHSVNERMELKSVDKIWKIVLGVLSKKRK